MHFQKVHVELGAYPVLRQTQRKLIRPSEALLCFPRYGISANHAVEDSFTIEYQV